MNLKNLQSYSMGGRLAAFCLLACASEALATTQTSSTPEALSVQTVLDCANFSPGAIDGKWGANTRGALRAFQNAHGLEASGELDAKTRETLRLDREDLFVDYTITSQDVAGPFIDKVPESPADQAKLDHLAFTSVTEAIAEKFHLTEAALLSLNPDAKLEDGTAIRVPNVHNEGGGEVSGPRQPVGAVRIVVTKSAGSLELLDAENNLIFYAPVTAGSEKEPLPLGDWEVDTISIDPIYYYDPELVLGGDPEEEEDATLPAGPNNPVGVVWIGLNKEHYGIHGTPEPSEIGYTKSSGCVRLTNWDAEKLAHMVSAGTQVLFQE